jgi:hypothetical protein
VPHVGHAAPYVGDDIDDGPAALLHRLVQALARHQETAGQVGLHHGIPALGGDVLERRRKLPTRVVDQRVDAAVLGVDLRHQRLHGSLVADVADVGMRGATGLDNLGAHGGELVGVAPHQCHRRAERGQFVRGTAADAAATARHDRHLPLEQPRTKNRAIHRMSPY